MEPKLELIVPKRRRFYRIPGLYWVSDSGSATNEMQRESLISASSGLPEAHSTIAPIQTSASLLLLP